MKVLKKANNQVEITKPLLDLARKNDVELRYDKDEELLTLFSANDDNAFIDYKVCFNPYNMTNFVVTLVGTYEMEDVKNIPQTLKTSNDYRDLFQAIQLAFTKI